MRTYWAAASLALALLAGCSTVPKADQGPKGTQAFYLQVEASNPGVRIETNGVFAGEAPLTLKVFGNEDRTFHDFGSPEYVVRALPLSTNQFVQTQKFRAGTKSSPGAVIPGLLFFEMNQQGNSFSLDLLPDK